MDYKKMPLSECPNCHFPLNAATNSGANKDTIPKPNDISICYRCGMLLLFDDELKLKKMDQETVNFIKNNCLNTWNAIIEIQGRINDRDRKLQKGVYSPSSGDDEV